MGYTINSYYGALTSINLPTTIDGTRVETVGTRCFCDSSITHITGDSVVNIDDSAFKRCTVLTSMSFQTCSSISYQAFAACTFSIASFSQCTYVGVGAFVECESLTVLSFPNCNYIDQSAFRSCITLATASFPNCSYISASAFAYCSSFTSLYLLSTSMVTLGATASTIFKYCSNYKIYVPSSLLATYQADTNWEGIKGSISGI